MTQILLTCVNCTTEFEPLEAAPHKRFCSARCRYEWHGKQRRRGLRLLREQEVSTTRSQTDEND